MTTQFKTCHISYAAPIYTLVLSTDENRISVELLNEFNACLDWTLAKREFGKPQALVVTNSNGKIFSNGLLLNLLVDVGASYFHKYQALLARLLAFPIPTVAAINGHAFAGGCMFAMAFDYRVMRLDRGYICMNEVDMPGPLTPGFHAILAAKIPTPVVIRDMILKGHRFTGSECLANGMIDLAVASQSELLDAANALAKQWAGKAAHTDANANVYMWLKEGVYRDTLDLLRGGNLGHCAKVLGLEDSTDIYKSKL